MDKLIYKNMYEVRFNFIKSYEVEFNCYPIVPYTNNNGEKGYSYISVHDWPNPLKEFDKDQVVNKMSGFYKWNIDEFECDIYFADELYDGDELGQLNDLYKECIQPFCEKEIHKKNKVLFDEKKH